MRSIFKNSSLESVPAAKKVVLFLAGLLAAWVGFKHWFFSDLIARLGVSDLYATLVQEGAFLVLATLFLYWIVYKLLGNPHDRNEAVNRQKLLMESAIDSVAEAVLLIDCGQRLGPENFRVVFTNKAFYKMTGFGPGETLGTNPLALLRGHKTDNKKLLRLFDAINSNSSFEEEIISYKKNGEPFWINLEVSPVRNELARQPGFFVAVVKDINDHKISVDEKNRLTNQVIQQNQGLQEFTQVISHNLRAPVANILGLISILDYSQPMGDYNRKLLDHLRESATNIDRIIADLNELLQVRESVLESRQTFGLKALIDEVLHSFHLQIERANAQIEVTVWPEDLMLHSVRSYFHSIVYNLATNGIKYRHPERSLMLKIEAYQTTSDLIVLVKDNGLGMDMKVVKEKMFKLYKRFHTHVEGKGMGLFLLKNQVERLGGKISVYSVLGKGTLFRVSIPLRNCEAATDPADQETLPVLLVSE